MMPTWSLTASTGIYWNLLLYLTIMGAIWYDWEDERLGPIAGFAIVADIVILLIIFVGGFFFSSEWVNTDQYRNLIGTIQETEFTANVQPIAPSQMLIVDKEVAERVGEKELGSDPGLGSRAKLGDFTLQAVNGQLYWIAPLLHSGFFQWNRYTDEGTPGYIRVSATNQEDYALVRSVDKKDLHIKYQTEACFGTDLERHIYINGYRAALFGDLTFEVDDQWHPYWTVTVYQTKIGFSGDDATGVLTIDPETGEIKSYSIASAPSWIDRIQPQDFVHDQIDNWGRYIKGYWNWSNTDVLRVAKESSIVLGSDGHAYYYFGLTSQGKENSTVGFVMVDTRTKKAHWFKQAGATEAAAKGSAEGKVQEKGYLGSDGVTYNIDGHPTYEFLLKDKGGLMKLIALVSVHDHTIVGVGENRQEALQDYRSQITNRGNTVSIATSDMEQVTITSRVYRFAAKVEKGNTYYEFILEKKPKLLFTAGNTLSDELSLTREGDMVKIHYVELNSKGEVSITNFDNLALGLQKDTIQEQNEARLDTVRQGKIEQKSAGVVDDKINNLSIEDKKKLLKQLEKK
jgi:hypothetical protein